MAQSNMPQFGFSSHDQRFRWVIILFCIICSAVHQGRGVQAVNSERAHVIPGTDLPVLTPRASIESTLGAKESKMFLIDSTPGRFIRIKAEQRGIDVTLIVASPDGT